MKLFLTFSLTSWAHFLDKQAVSQFLAKSPCGDECSEVKGEVIYNYHLRLYRLCIIILSKIVSIIISNIIILIISKIISSKVPPPKIENKGVDVVTNYVLSFKLYWSRERSSVWKNKHSLRRLSSFRNTKSRFKVHRLSLYKVQ